MKSDPRPEPLGAASVADVQAGVDAGPHAGAPEGGAGAPPEPVPGRRSGRAAWLVQLLLVVAVPVVLLVVASLAAIAIVRVGADLRLGIDPFLAEAARPRLTLSELAARGIATDLARQVVIVLMVLALARWQDGAAWPRRLALTRPAEPRTPLRHVWLLLLLWPAIHILWVTETARALQVGFGRGTHLSPYLTPASVAGWFVYVALLAPMAEELLMRGEAFARASRLLRPAGAIAATAMLFSIVHLSDAGIARPISLLPLAITLGWLRWRSGRLWPCILLHGWSNLALVLFLLWPISR